VPLGGPTVNADLMEQKAFFDLGHQGDIDYTQIRRMLAMTPDERLDRHEAWRLFLKEARSCATLRSRGDREASARSS
jgi:hypothetical protein